MSYGAINDVDVKEKKTLLSSKEELPQPTVTHSHLIPTCVAFTAFYAYVSIAVCLRKMRDISEMRRNLIFVNIGLVFMFLWSYLTAAMTNPGKMEQCTNPSEDEVDQTSRWYCKTCKVMKPLRCHHCRRCNRCVLKMDHHCYWIDNCVGLYNMKYFYLTLLYGCSGTFFMFSVYVSRWSEFLYYSVKISNIDMVLLTLATLFIAAHGSTVMYLFVFHTYLLSKDRTSVEHRCCKGVKPGCNHDKGLVGNFMETFGSIEGFMLYLLPVASIHCSNLRRRERQELIDLYSDHSLALPYFEKAYGYSNAIESESPDTSQRKNVSYEEHEDDSDGSVML